MNAIVYTHLGLGDSIICNGLMREFASRLESLLTFAKPQNLESVRWMYRDQDNIHVIPMDYDQINSFIKDTKPSNLLLVGDAGMGCVEKCLNFDEWFYWQHDLDFEKRWSQFYIQRDFVAESMLTHKVFALNNMFYSFGRSNEYALIHQDDRFRCDRVETKLPKIYINPRLTGNIFDYCQLIENATEFHCIESSFLFLADSIPTKGKLIAHRYARHYPEDNTPTLKKEWEIIK